MSVASRLGLLVEGAGDDGKSPVTAMLLQALSDIIVSTAAQLDAGTVIITGLTRFGTYIYCI